MRAHAIALVLFVAGCAAELDEIRENDISVEVCPDALGGCELVADGESRVSLRVRIASPDPHPDLEVRLRATSGTFVGAQDPSRPGEIEVAIPEGDDALATFVPDKVAGHVRIDAEVGGLVVPTILTLRAADVANVEIAPSPSRLGDDTPVALRVEARALTGSLSAGTVARVAVDPGSIEPDTAYVQVFPSSGLVDATGTFEATLHKDASLLSVSLTVTVEPPSVAGVPTSTSVSRTLSLTAP